MRGVLAILLICLFACNERVQVNAPYQDLWVVYGVLDPGRDTQDIRISRGFQVEGNAFEYARENDLSLKGLQVTLQGAGNNYLAWQVDSVPKSTEGDFFPYGTVYRLVTRDQEKLRADSVYTLKISRPGDSAFFLSAQTRIPPEPQIISPVITGQFGQSCLTNLALEDSFQVSFRTSINGIPRRVRAYELAVVLDYFADGQPRRYRFGPRFITGSRGCPGNQNTICYEFGGGTVLQSMAGSLNDPNVKYTYFDKPVCGWIADLPRSLRVEVAALDSALADYIQINNSTAPTYATVLPEYTNIRARSGIPLGIFGSINRDDVPVLLTICSMHNLRMNGVFNPEACD